MENKVIHISSKTQYKEIVSSSKRVIVLFGASWCPACKEAMISYKKYAFRYSKYIKFLSHSTFSDTLLYLYFNSEVTLFAFVFCFFTFLLTILNEV